MRSRKALVEELLRSDEPSIRWRTRVRVLGERRESAPIRELERAVRSSPRVSRLLSHRHAPHRAGTSRSIYYYWQGLHWVLAALADLGYPREDPELLPIRDRVVDLWTDRHYRTDQPVRSKEEIDYRRGVPYLQGRARRCASQQGNALFAVTELGLLDERGEELAELLQHWQWPDGGWNCDRDPDADTSSFCETLTPMVGLQAFGESQDDELARRAARRAAEVFLERRLCRRRSDGKLMDPHFLRRHYPLYWHYDVLGGLKAMARLGLLRDPRCAEALDWLEATELPNGGWSADERYYRISKSFSPSSEFVNWGPTGRGTSNPWVTTDALWVLRLADRAGR